MPGISRQPPALTPAAIRQCTFTVRPPFQHAEARRQDRRVTPPGGHHRGSLACSAGCGPTAAIASDPYHPIPGDDAGFAARHTDASVNHRLRGVIPVQSRTYEIIFSGQAGRTLRAQFDDCEVTTNPETTTLR